MVTVVDSVTIQKPALHLGNKYIMKINEITTKTVNEDASAGGTSSASFATVPGVGSSSKVGTLFGGTYKQQTTKKRKAK